MAMNMRESNSFCTGDRCCHVVGTLTATTRTWRSRITRALASGLKERAQLLELMREANQRGVLDTDAFAMFEGAMAVAELQVRDIMVPRAEMISLRRGDSVEQILSAVVASGHSRFPVVDGDRDDVVGMLLAKDLLRLQVAADEDFEIREFGIAGTRRTASCRTISIRGPAATGAAPAGS